jgi:transcriptional regulator with PAS, ATPase and Fis domain
VRTGSVAVTSGAISPLRNRRSDAEILTVLNQVAGLDRALRREGVKLYWSGLGLQSSQELHKLAKAFGLQLENDDVISVEEMGSRDLDALFYLPLDVQQPRQIEQLVRLSMVAPRVRHVALAETPKWSQSQLVALRETWQWVDPRMPAKLVGAAEDIFRNMGISLRSDVPKPESREPEVREPMIVTRSPLLKDILTLVDAVADTDSTILITGESGTGKELIAQRIHARSHRKGAPIVAVNCGAIPGELLESELFGHMKGAFTGAISNREGRFEAAEGGTLFLDEIGEMGASLQVKLLRVLQTRQYEPVGATKSRASNVRIVAATNRDLEAEVKEGRFREDLFYRLNVIPVHIPSLRERPEDIPMLAEYFIKRFNHEKSRRVTGLTRASLRALVAYEWPGNVRELENLVERMVILKSSGMIDVLDFPEKYRRKCLSEIEYEDLINARRIFGAQAPAAAQIPVIETSSDEKDMGGEAMKISGTAFITKSAIEQVAPQAPAPIDVPAGQLSMEQILQLAADRFTFPTEGLDFNSIVDQFENILILHALERTGWNRNRAAGLLRLNRTTLVEKLKKKQLQPPLSIGGEILEGNA